MWAREARRLHAGKCQKRYWGNKLIWGKGWECGYAMVKRDNGRYGNKLQKGSSAKLKESIGQDHVW